MKRRVYSRVEREDERMLVGGGGGGVRKASCNNTSAGANLKSFLFWNCFCNKTEKSCVSKNIIFFFLFWNYQTSQPPVLHLLNLETVQHC